MTTLSSDAARCVIGIGCDDHGDQIAGLLVARRVAALTRGDIAVHESTGAPAELVAAWQGADDAIVVEAMPGAVPGTVLRCQPHPRPLAASCSPTRLSPELREAMAIGPLPDRLTVITIAAERFASSAGVSPEVADAAHRIAEDLADVRPAPAPTTMPDLPAPVAARELALPAGV